MWSGREAYHSPPSIKVKVKLSPLRLQGCEMSRIPHCLANRHADGSKVVISTHRPHSTLREHYVSASGSNFC
jgi:hypothetical protein